MPTSQLIKCWLRSKRREVWELLLKSFSEHWGREWARGRKLQFVRLLSRLCLPLLCPVPFNLSSTVPGSKPFSVCKPLPVDSHRIPKTVFFLLLINFGQVEWNQGLPSKREMFPRDTTGGRILSLTASSNPPFLHRSYIIALSWHHNWLLPVYFFLWQCTLASLLQLCLQLSINRSAFQ